MILKTLCNGDNPGGDDDCDGGAVSGDGDDRDDHDDHLHAVGYDHDDANVGNDDCDGDEGKGDEGLIWFLMVVAMMMMVVMVRNGDGADGTGGTDMIVIEMSNMVMVTVVIVKGF